LPVRAASYASNPVSTGAALWPNAELCSAAPSDMQLVPQNPDQGKDLPRHLLDLTLTRGRTLPSEHSCGAA
jgi:hypothetical protein